MPVGKKNMFSIFFVNLSLGFSTSFLIEKLDSAEKGIIFIITILCCVPNSNGITSEYVYMVIIMLHFQFSTLLLPYI